MIVLLLSACSLNSNSSSGPSPTNATRASEAASASITQVVGSPQGATPTSGTDQRSATQNSPNAVSQTSTLSSFPPGCSNAEVTAALDRFIGAFNRGDQDVLDEVFPATSSSDPSTNDFHVFGISAVSDGPAAFVAYASDELLPYLADRHVLHDQIQLIGLKIVSSWAVDRVGLDMQLSRQADDVTLHTGVAKGELVCSTHQIVVWNMQG